MIEKNSFILPKDMDKAHTVAATLFTRTAAFLRSILPVSAEILHVGATAVPECLTKGDLDIVVRVKQDDFVTAHSAIAAEFGTNEGSVKTEGFAAFEDKNSIPELGIQLTAVGGAFDFFHKFSEFLRTHPQQLEKYRAAKDAFISETLDCLNC